jgi:hypothetical protein
VRYRCSRCRFYFDQSRYSSRRLVRSKGRVLFASSWHKSGAGEGIVTRRSSREAPLFVGVCQFVGCGLLLLAKHQRLRGPGLAPGDRRFGPVEDRGPAKLDCGRHAATQPEVFRICGKSVAAAARLCCRRSRCWRRPGCPMPSSGCPNQPHEPFLRQQPYHRQLPLPKVSTGYA